MLKVTARHQSVCCLLRLCRLLVPASRVSRQQARFLLSVCGKAVVACMHIIAQCFDPPPSLHHHHHRLNYIPLPANAPADAALFVRALLAALALMAPFPFPASDSVSEHHSTSTHSSSFTTSPTTSPTPSSLTATRSPDPDPSNDKRLLAAIVVLFLVAAALLAFIVWLTLRVKRREEAARLRAQAEAAGIPSSGRGIASDSSPTRKRRGGTVDRRDKAGKVMHADHPAAQITPFGGAPPSVGGGHPRFEHTPGTDMRIALRRPDGAWDFADPRTPFKPAGVSELESDIVPAVPPLTRLSVNLLGMGGAHRLSSPGAAGASPVANPFSPVSPNAVANPIKAHISTTTVSATVSPFSPVSPSTPPGISNFSTSAPISFPAPTAAPRADPLEYSYATFNKPLPVPQPDNDPLSLPTPTSFAHREPTSPFSYITEISHGTPAQTPRNATSPRTRELTGTLLSSPAAGTYTRTPLQTQPVLYHYEREIDRDRVPSSPFSYVTDPSYAPTSVSEARGADMAAARKEAEARWERERERALGGHGSDGDAEGGAPPAYWDGRPN